MPHFQKVTLKLKKKIKKMPKIPLNKTKEHDFTKNIIIFGFYFAHKIAHKMLPTKFYRTVVCKAVPFSRSPYLCGQLF